jgi:hypothetical protein
MLRAITISDEIRNCRLCGHDQLEPLLDFGSTALANSYLSQEELNDWEITVPLRVVKCLKCNCVQLKDTVNPQLLFSNYQYESSSSGNLKKHFEGYAKEIFDSMELDGSSIVVDIGGNDGVLLEPFKNLGVQVLNVEPAKNLAEKCEQKGIPTINKFFNKEVALEIIKTYGYPDVITCNNCFAHVPKLDDIVDGLELLMSNGAVFSFENAYLLDTVQGKMFDQVYHEHTFYHGIKPLVEYFKSRGFTLWRVDYNQNQGGSFRAFVSYGDSVPALGSVSDAIKKEEDAGLYDIQTYYRLLLDIKKKKLALSHILNTAKGENKKVVAYGAPAKFTTFCEVLGLDHNVIDYVVDDAPNKIGRYTPGTKLPIKSSAEMVQDNPDLILITAWNFADFIVAKFPQFSGKFIVPFPDIKIV